MTHQDFLEILDKNNFTYSSEEAELLGKYHDLLLEWNSKINLISRKEHHLIYEKHILHSLSVLKFVELPAKAKCLDIGSGGGLPGIPLGIAQPGFHMILADSIAKKVVVQREIVAALRLKNVDSFHGRVEEMAKEHHSSFDVIFARGVSRIVDLIEWTRTLRKTNGCYVLLKGGDLQEELVEAQRKFRNLSFDRIPINMDGCPWFTEDQKSIVVVSSQ